MNHPLRIALCTAAIAASLTLAGCGRPVYYAPPPPIAYAPPPADLDLASRNGFRMGLDDGNRDSYYGRPFSAQRTPAFREAPGYDPNLGPLGPYVNTFRNAYLRGYDKAYYHRP